MKEKSAKIHTRPAISRRRKSESPSLNGAHVSFRNSTCFSMMRDIQRRVWLHGDGNGWGQTAEEIAINLEAPIHLRDSSFRIFSKLKLSVRRFST